MSATTSLTKPHFFQPLIPGFEDKFFIPASFFKYLKGLECHELTARSPGGKLWHIKINGRQFSDGWKQFVQDHDLQIGDLLVFRHQGDLVFDFLVFDRSTCEREYPPFVPIKEKETQIQQENVPIYTSSGKKPERKKRAKSYSVLESPYPNRVIKLSPDTIKKNRLHIPRNFARENGLYGRSCSIILKDEYSNCWRAKLIYTSSDKKLIVSAGWSVFHSVHEFKAGDFLMVELIKNEETPVFQIRKIQEHSEFSWEPMYANAKAGHIHAESKAFEIKTSYQKTSEVAKGLGSEYLGRALPQCKAFSGKKQAAGLPHFYVNMQASYYRNSQKIPRDFAKRHGLRECSAVTIRNETGKSWLVLLRLDYDTNEVYMTLGWIEFVRENGIQEEDVFMLELVKGGTKPEMIYYGLKQ